MVQTSGLLQAATSGVKLLVFRPPAGQRWRRGCAIHHIKDQLELCPILGFTSEKDVHRPTDLNLKNKTARLHVQRKFRSCKNTLLTWTPAIDRDHTGPDV